MPFNYKMPEKGGSNIILLSDGAQLFTLESNHYQSHFTFFIPKFLFSFSSSLRPYIPEKSKQNNRLFKINPMKKKLKSKERN